MKYFTQSNVQKFALFFVCLLCSVIANGATWTATTSGNWNANATWGGSTNPGTGSVNDIYIIPEGISVTVTSIISAYALIEVRGTLTFSTGGSLNTGNNNGSASTTNYGTSLTSYNIQMTRNGATLNTGGLDVRPYNLTINTQNTTDVVYIQGTTSSAPLLFGNNANITGTLTFSKGLLKATDQYLRLQKGAVITGTANGNFATSIDGTCLHTDADAGTVIIAGADGSTNYVQGANVNFYNLTFGSNNFILNGGSYVTVLKTYTSLRTSNGGNPTITGGVFRWGPNSLYTGTFTPKGEYTTPITSTGPAYTGTAPGTANALYVTPAAIQAAIDACYTSLDKPQPTVSNPTCNSLQISWAPISGANSYNLYTVSSAITNDTVLVQTGVTSPFTHTNLVSGTTYYYKLKAIASPTDASLSNAVSGTTTSEPMPTLDGVPNYTEIALTFNVPVTATGFTLYRCTSANTGCTELVTSGTSFNDTGLTEGTTYYYKIVATFAGGCTSEIIQPIKTLADVIYPDTPFGETGVVCQSSCSTTLVGYVNFANKNGTDTGRWTLNDIATYGPATQTITTGLSSTSGTVKGTGQYTIVKNPSSLGEALQNIDAPGGLFVVQNSSDLLTYTIKGLYTPLDLGVTTNGATHPDLMYCIRIKMRNLGTAGGCSNVGNNISINIKDPDGNNFSVGDLFYVGSSRGTNGKYTVTNTLCSAGNRTGTWGGNGQISPNPIGYDGDYTVLEGCFMISGGRAGDAMFTNDDGFQLVINGADTNGDNVTGIQSIEVYGCIPKVLEVLDPSGKQLAKNKNYTTCQGESLFLFATSGFATDGEPITWKRQEGTGPVETLPTTASKIAILAPSEDVSVTYTAEGSLGSKSIVISGVFCCNAVGETAIVHEEHFSGLTFGACSGARQYADIPGKGVTNFISSSYLYAGDACDVGNNTPYNCINDGEYAVVQNSNACDYWGGTWSLAEHTGDAGGMLLVNASPSTFNDYFYEHSLTGLCDGTRYEFSSWYAALNYTNPAKANIDFEVWSEDASGVPVAKIANFLTGDLNTDSNWHQAVINFKTPTSGGTGNYRLRIRNNSNTSNTNGNDVVLDDIMVTKCVFTFNTITTDTKEKEVSICTDKPISLEISTPYNIREKVASGNTVWVQWVYSSSPSGPWTKLTPEAIANDTIHELTADMFPDPGATRYYRAKLSADKTRAESISPLLNPTDCGNDALSSSFTLYKQDNLNISITNPISTPYSVCEGKSIVLQGATTEADATWGWKRGLSDTDNFITGSGSATSQETDKAYTIPSMSTADAGTYYFIVQNGACVSNKSINLSMITAVQGGAVNSDVSVCSGTNSSPLAVSGYAGTIKKWQSSVSPFTTWTDIANTATTYTATNLNETTKYRAVVGSEGCDDAFSTPATVTVNPTPTVTITNPSAVCAPATVDLTATAVTAGSTAGLTYTYWTDALASTSLTSPAAVSTSGTYYIKGTIAATGCFSIQPVIVTINPTPTVMITNPSAVCAPATVDLTAAAVTAGSTAGLTYTYWTDALASTSLTSPAAVSTSGTYYIKGTIAATGCFSIQPVTVTINPTPTVTITNPAAVCSPGTVDVTAAAVTAGSTAGLMYTYWTDAAASTSLTSPAAVSTSDTYYIKGTIAATGCYVVQPVVVTIYPLPTVMITNPFAVCAPATVDLTASSVTAGSTAGLTYTYWTDALASTSLTSPVAVNTSGTYYIKGTIAATGCRDVKAVDVVVNTPFIATLNANPMYVQIDELVTLTTTVVPSGTYNYSWSNNLPMINEATNIDRPITMGEKTYSVIVTDLDELCSSTANVSISVSKLPTAITPYIVDGKNDTFASGYDIVVFNRLGQVVYDSEGAKIGWDGSINGKTADPGVYYYIIRITNGNIKGTIEVIKKNY